MTAKWSLHFKRNTVKGIDVWISFLESIGNKLFSESDSSHFYSVRGVCFFLFLLSDHQSSPHSLSQLISKIEQTSQISLSVTPEHLSKMKRNQTGQNWKYLNFRFVPDFEASCLTDTAAWLAYAPRSQNESEGRYTYIRRCPISSPAEGLIYVFCWHHLTGTLVLQMGTGDVVRIISLQVTHCQNDVRGAGSEDYG